MSPLLSPRGRSANRQCFEGTLGAPALNYVTLLGILRLAEVGMRSCRRKVRNTLRNRLVVCSTAMLTYLPELPFTLLFFNVRLYAHDFYRADMGL